jgi:hypothetical protein
MLSAAERLTVNVFGRVPAGMPVIGPKSSTPAVIRDHAHGFCGSFTMRRPISRYRLERRAELGRSAQTDALRVSAGTGRSNGGSAPKASIARSASPIVSQIASGSGCSAANCVVPRCIRCSIRSCCAGVSSAQNCVSQWFSRTIRRAQASRSSRDEGGGLAGCSKARTALGRDTGSDATEGAGSCDAAVVDITSG